MNVFQLQFEQFSFISETFHDKSARFFPLLNDETLITSIGNLTICYLYFILRSVCKHVHFIYFKLLFRCMRFSFLYFHTFFSSFVDCARALINLIFLVLFSFRRSESISRFCSFQHDGTDATQFLFHWQQYDRENLKRWEFYWPGHLLVLSFFLSDFLTFALSLFCVHLMLSIFYFVCGILIDDAMILLAYPFIQA